MKKIFLLSSFVVGFATAANAQDFTFDAQTVTENTAGLDLSDPNVVLDDAVTIYNHVNNSSENVLSGMKWQIIETFDNSVAPHINWQVHSFCDNMTCYIGTLLTVPGSNPVEYKVFDFGDIAGRAKSDFKMQIVVPQTATNGTSGAVKVRAWSANQSDTAIFIVTKTPVGINTIKLNDNRVSVFPNPSTGDMKVFVNKELNARELAVYNILGAKVASVSVQDEISTINSANFASGNYFVKVIGQNGEVITSRKWLKQ